MFLFKWSHSVCIHLCLDTFIYFLMWNSSILLYVMIVISFSVLSAIITKKHNTWCYLSMTSNVTLIIFTSFVYIMHSFLFGINKGWNFVYFQVFMCISKYETIYQIIFHGMLILTSTDNIYEMVVMFWFLSRLWVQDYFHFWKFTCCLLFRKLDISLIYFKKICILKILKYFKKQMLLTMRL
jgi:hypothetical protein